MVVFMSVVFWEAIYGGLYVCRILGSHIVLYSSYSSIIFEEAIVGFQC